MLISELVHFFAPSDPQFIQMKERNLGAEVKTQSVMCLLRKHGDLSRDPQQRYQSQTWRCYNPSSGEQRQGDLGTH